jgi:hypothetical protein
MVFFDTRENEVKKVYFFYFQLLDMHLESRTWSIIYSSFLKPSAQNGISTSKQHLVYLC